MKFDARQTPTDVARAQGDVARAPSPLQQTDVQGRGGLATPGGDVARAQGDVARASSPLQDVAFSMPNVVQTWKSVSSHRINKLLCRRGVLWQSDYYNHIIRTPSEYVNQLGYVLRNNMVSARQFDVGIGDVARAPSPLQAGYSQGRGGLATPGGDVARAPSPLQQAGTQGDVARAPSPLQSADNFPGKDKRFWSDIDIYQGEALPRWSLDRAIYHICFRLADSVPQAKLREWEAAREEFRLKRRNGEALSEDELRELKNLYSENIERYLDSGYGECLLRKSGVAGVIVETFLHDNGKKYCLHAYGIMPNHVHVIAEFDVGLQGRGGLATPCGDVARAPSPLQADEAQADVARAPSPLQADEAQGDVARAPSPLHDGRSQGDVARAPSPLHDGRSQGDVARAPSPLHDGRSQGDVARAPSPLHDGRSQGDVARAPSPLQQVVVQGRGGLATSGLAAKGGAE